MSLPVGGEARGLAGVFGTSINPLSVYMGYASQRQRNKAALEQQYKASRDKYLEDQNKWNPEGAWEDMYDIVSKNVAAGRQSTLTEIERNGGVVNDNVRRNNIQWQAHANELAKKTMALKEVYTKAYSDIEANPLMNKVYAKSRLNDKKDQWRAALETGTSIDDNLEEINSDPKAWDTNAVANAFVDKLDDQVTDFFGKTVGPNGEYLTKTELTSKLPYETQVNSRGMTEWKLDKYGKKILKDDDTLLILARNNAPLNLKMEEAVGTDEAKQRQWLKNTLPGFDKTKQTGNITTGFKNEPENDPRNSAFGINFGMNVSNIEARRDWLEKATSGNRPDLLKAIGNVTKDIKADYSADKKKIIIEFPSSIEDSDILRKIKVDSEEAGALLVPGKTKGTYTLDISTPQLKRAARQALSEIIDSQLRDSKQAIGTDNYVRYEEAYAQSKQKGASGIKWK